MNKQQFYTAGGLLLATTALTSAANAGTFVVDPTTTNFTTLFGSATAFKAVNVANTLFSTTASKANSVVIGPLANLAVQFTNQYTGTTKFSVEIDITGASFIQTSVTPTLLLSTTGTFAATLAATTAGCAVTPLTNKILIQGCDSVGVALSTTTSAQFVGLTFPGLEFNNGSALATAGSSIALSGLVTDAGGSGTTFEAITSANIITSAAPFTTTITAAGNAVASSTATPTAFSYLATQGGVGAYLTMSLATINISGTGTVDQFLTTQVTPDTTALASINVTVTDSLLSSGAVAAFVTSNTAGYSQTTATVTNFSGGSATFSINAAIDAFATVNVNVIFNGTTAIPAAAAGTVAVTYASSAQSAQTYTAATGSTATLSLGGFSSELNTFLSSTATGYGSFARIHNNGGLAGAVSIAVKNDATGAVIGSTFTTPAIAPGETLQLSAAQIETSAGITPTSGLNYTLSFSGPISGYVQYIIFNSATGQLADFSAFRNGGGNNAGVTTP